MRLLVCASEYFPQGSGIANVAFNIVEQLKKKEGVECVICSPDGPDIKLGNQWLIQKFGFLGLLYYWFTVSLFFKKEGAYDIVWLHNPYFILYNPFQKCLITIHSTYYGLSYNKSGNAFFLQVYNRVISIFERHCMGKIGDTTAFTGVSQSVCQELERVGIPKGRILYIPNGVDIIKFHPIEDKIEVREKFGIPVDEIVLLSIGRLTPQKQPLVLVDIFSIIEKRIGNLSLYISGKGELFHSTNEHVKKMNLFKIHFLGYIKEQDLPDLYACCDYYIMTSNYEGLPLTLLEAMASGLPCIVSDIRQLDIVGDANCGLIVRFEDVEKASDKIFSYLTGIHQDHSNNARKYAVNTLSWEIIARKYYELIKNCSKSSIGKQ